MALEASSATSHAVPTSGLFDAPHCSLETNLVMVSSPFTFTRKRALASGNGNGLQMAPGFSICVLQQSSVAS